MKIELTRRQSQELATLARQVEAVVAAREAFMLGLTLGLGHDPEDERAAFQEVAPGRYVVTFAEPTPPPDMPAGEPAAINGLAAPPASAGASQS